LDAALAAHWGPDDFPQRLTLSARLADVAAHLTDHGRRRTAHLWRLTTAWECLDVVAVQRQLRALDLLAEETGHARDAFYAASRRAMQALVTGDIDTADQLIAATRERGAQAAEPDLDAVVHSLVAERARQTGDVETLSHEAAAFGAYGAAQGVPSVSAQAAVLWVAAGEPDQARRLLHQLAGGGIDAVPRDVDFLLTVTSIVEVAAALHNQDILADGVPLLTPYAGRAVLNAGAVTFHGVVDDYLHAAEYALGQRDPARWRHQAVSAYQRIGAAWWQHRLTAPAVLLPQAAAVAVHLHRHGDNGWLVGSGSATSVLPDVKGLHYVSELLRHPGVAINALDLSTAASSHTGITVTDTSTGVLADKQALAAYRRRLRDIDTELDHAQSWSDQGHVDRLRDERDALLTEVRRTTGLGGRHRHFTSTEERARVAVRKAIAATLDRIEHHDRAVARLLRDTIHTGITCRYEPDPHRPVTWLLNNP
jgi:hypothetical protein